jgi:hypothetical protein
MFRLAISLLSAALLSCCCASAAAPSPSTARTPAAHSRPAKPAPNISDADLERTIRTRFARSKISTNHFEVHVQGGVALIEGRTNVIQHKGTATRIARSSGAREVRNKILISEEARRKARANLEKGRRKAQVKRGA